MQKARACSSVEATNGQAGMTACRRGGPAKNARREAVRANIRRSTPRAKTAVKVRIGPLEDNSLLSRTLGTMPHAIVTSPIYLSSRGRPTGLSGLVGYCIVGLRPMVTLTADGPDGPTTVTLEAQVAVNDPMTMVAVIRGGSGIGIVPRFLAHAALDDGTLEILLP